MRDRTLTDRLALAASEHRQELGLTVRELSEWSGVSEGTINRLERGVRVRPELALRVAGALTVLDLYRQPRVMLDDTLRALIDAASERVPT